MGALGQKWFISLLHSKFLLARFEISDQKADYLSGFQIDLQIESMCTLELIMNISNINLLYLSLILHNVAAC